MRISENNARNYSFNMESTGINGNSSQADTGNKRTCQQKIDGGSGDDRIDVFSFPGGSTCVDGGSGDDVITIGRYMDNDYDNITKNSGGAEHMGANDFNNSGTKNGGSTEPVAANETGKVWGDPHFVGGDGDKFDVQGEAGKTYNLLSDKGLQVNGRFDKFNNDGLTVVGQTGIKVRGSDGQTSEVGLSKDGTATIDGQKMQEGQTYNLADGGTSTLNGKKLTTTTGEGYTIEQDVAGSGNNSYIDMTVKTGKNGVDNGRMPGGLLGQTFDADKIARNGKTGIGAQGEGAIEGRVQDYETGGLFDSRSSRPDTQNLKGSGNLDVNGGSGDDRIYVNTGGNGPAETHSSGGHGSGGNDEIALNKPGNHFVNGGSGDDTVQVNFSGKNNSATIEGGSGNDTVLLAGAMLDYIMSSQGGFNIYTDQNNNSIRIANDVENVRFKN